MLPALFFFSSFVFSTREKKPTQVMKPPKAFAPAVSRGQGRKDAVYDAVNAVSNSGNIANAEEFILIVCKIV